MISAEDLKVIKFKAEAMKYQAEHLREAVEGECEDSVDLLYQANVLDVAAANLGRLIAEVERLHSVDRKRWLVSKAFDSLSQMSTEEFQKKVEEHKIRTWLKTCKH